MRKLCNNDLTVCMSFVARFLFGFLLVTGTIFAVQYAFYTYADGYSLPTVEQPIEILNENNEIAIGEVIEMTIRMEVTEVFHVHDADVYITCQGGNLITLEGTSISIPLGVHEIPSTRFVLPNKVSTGDVCKMHFDVLYEINPVIDEVQKLISEEFTVIKGE